MTKIISITHASWVLLQRMVLRTLALGALTIAGVFMLELMVQSGIENRFGLVQRFPEMLSMMKAAAVLTFIEMSVFWIRFSTSPKLDVQDLAQSASHDRKAAATVYAVNKAEWLARVLLLVYLMGPI